MDGSEDGQEAVLETVRASITLRLGTGLDPRHSVSSSLEMTMTTTVNRDGEDGPLEDRVGAIMPQIPHLVEAHPGNRSGRAITSVIVENTAVSPSDGPCFDDCYTPLLHNPTDGSAARSRKRSGKQPGGCWV
jgi:hypothetical protein